MGEERTMLGIKRTWLKPWEGMVDGKHNEPPCQVWFDLPDSDRSRSAEICFPKPFTFLGHHRGQCKNWPPRYMLSELHGLIYTDRKRKGELHKICRGDLWGSHLRSPWQQVTRNNEPHVKAIEHPTFIFNHFSITKRDGWDWQFVLITFLLCHAARWS